MRRGLYSADPQKRVSLLLGDRKLYVVVEIEHDGSDVVPLLKDWVPKVKETKRRERKVSNRSISFDLDDETKRRERKEFYRSATSLDLEVGQTLD